MNLETYFKVGTSSTSITGFKSKFRLPPRISFLFFKVNICYSIRFLFAHVEKHANQTLQSSITASYIEKFLFKRCKRFCSNINILQPHLT